MNMAPTEMQARISAMIRSRVTCFSSARVTSRSAWATSRSESVATVSGSASAGSIDATGFAASAAALFAGACGADFSGVDAMIVSTGLGSTRSPEIGIIAIFAFAMVPIGMRPLLSNVDGRERVGIGPELAAVFAA